jgi:cytoskeletal protein CcmA (bactofilin family)
LTNPSNDDVYAAGGSVSLQSTIAGDAYAAGGDVTVGQAVEQDVVAAGGTVTINGTVGDDARLAGGTIIVNSAVADDLVVAGGSITINSDIGGDLVVTGGQVVLNGNVGGAVKIAAGSVTLNGTVTGPSEIKAETIVLQGTMNGPGRYVATKSFSVQSGSSFNAPFEYYQPSGEYNFAPYLKNGATAKFQSNLAPTDTSKKAQAWAAQAFGWFELLTLLSAMLVLALLVGICGRYLVQVADDFRKHFWLRAAGGLIYFIVLPVLALLLLITIIGIPLGVLTIAILILSMIFAKTLTAAILALWLLKRSNKQWMGWRLWLVAVAAYIALRLVVVIPVIGWLISALIVCATFGSLLHFKWTLFRQGMAK